MQGPMIHQIDDPKKNNKIKKETYPIRLLIRWMGLIMLSSFVLAPGCSHRPSAELDNHLPRDHVANLNIDDLLQTLLPKARQEVVDLYEYSKRPQMTPDELLDFFERTQSDAIRLAVLKDLTDHPSFNLEKAQEKFALTKHDHFFVENFKSLEAWAAINKEKLEEKIATEEPTALLATWKAELKKSYSLQKIISNPLILPLLAKNVCKNPLYLDLTTAHLKGLKTVYNLYFSGQFYECTNKVNLAETAYTTLYRQNQHPVYSWLGLRSLILLTRPTEKREISASRLVELMAGWEMLEEEIGKKLALNPTQINIWMIEDALWTARYQALIGQYSLAKKYATFAQNRLNSIGELNAALRALKWETHHVFAYRIYLETGELELAKQSMFDAKNALSTEDTLEWKERIYWFAGFFALLNNKLDESLDLWTQLEGMTGPASSLLPQIYFWKAYIYHQKGDANQVSPYLEKLFSEDPLNFYSLIGVRLLSKGDVHRRHIQNRIQKALDRRSYYPYDVRLDKNEDRDLLRLQFAAVLRLPYRIFQDLEKEFLENRSQWPLSVDSYLMRLRVFGGYPDQAIFSYAATKKRHPGLRTIDLVDLLYPKPWKDLYKKAAEQFSVPEEILLGVSRQESAFKADAMSSVRARGLMQLMYYTAKRLTDDKVQIKAEEDLFIPEKNIYLGAKYIHDLFKYFDNNAPAAFAAYNAGEFAVQQWLKNRNPLKDTDPNISTLVWIELIPFFQTKQYVKHVWRNQIVYEWLKTQD